MSTIITRTYELKSFILNTCHVNYKFLIQDEKQQYEKPEKKPIRQPTIDNKYSAKQTKDPRKPVAEPLTKTLVVKNNYSLEINKIPIS